MAAGRHLLGVFEYRLSPPFELSVFRRGQTTDEGSCFDNQLPDNTTLQGDIVPVCAVYP